MQTLLEDLEHQRRAIATAISVLDGQVRNSFDNSNIFGIQANVTDLTPAQIDQNKRRLLDENGVLETDAKLTPDNDICIEMETGTGKTLVCFRTICELFQHYRLTPFDAYRQGMVKKIEVLSVAEKNDEATLKLELIEVEAKGIATPKAKLNLWRRNGDGFKWKESNWLKQGDNIAEKSGNVSYADYSIDRIWKSLHDKLWHLKFSNGVELIEKERAADFTGLFRQQLQWLIRRHFEKKAKLTPMGIKCLSLIIIDRVDNYIKDDGIIKALCREEYAALCREHTGTEPSPDEITAASSAPCGISPPSASAPSPRFRTRCLRRPKTHRATPSSPPSRTSKPISRIRCTHDTGTIAFRKNPPHNTCG